MPQESTVTVLTPAASRQCTTLDIARDELGISDSSWDGRLTRWIDAASSAIVDHIGRELAQEQLAERITCLGRTGLCLLSRYPVVSIDSVMIGDTALTTDNYLLDPVSGRLALHGSTIPSGWEPFYWDQWPASVPLSYPNQAPYIAVTVQYTGGYVLPDSVPPPIQDACILILQRRKAWFARDPSILSQSVAGVLSTTYAVNAPGADTAIPADAQGLLEAFREFRL